MKTSPKLYDKQILELVATYGSDDFSKIAEHIPGISARKLRDRYVNFLKPIIQDTSWSSEEDKILIDLHQKSGGRWDLISKHFDNRSLPKIKNRYFKVARKKSHSRQIKSLEDVLIPPKEQIPQEPDLHQSEILFPSPGTEITTENYCFAQDDHQGDLNLQIDGLDDHDTTKIFEDYTLNHTKVSVSEYLKDYHIIKTLGSGSSSLVVLVEKESSSELFSAKIIPLNSSNLNQELKKTYQEISFMKFLQHDNIIKYYDHFCTDDNKYMVIIMDYCEQDLFNYIFRSQNNPKKLKEIIFGIASAVQYLHHNHIVHYDIKPENILLKNGKPVLSDFGFAKLHLVYPISIIHATTSNFAGPEFFLRQPILAFESDIYALGITFYVIATHDSRIYDKNQLSIMNRALYEELNIDESDELQQLAKWCTAKDPKKRPTIDQVLNHKFFKS